MGIGQALDTILQFFSSGLFLNVLHFHQIHPSSGLYRLDRGSSRSATYSGIREGQGKRFFPQELRVSKRLLCRFCVLRGGSPTFKRKLCVTYQGSPQPYLFTFTDCGHSKNSLDILFKVVTNKYLLVSNLSYKLIEIFVCIKLLEMSQYVQILYNFKTIELITSRTHLYPLNLFKCS